MTGSTFGVYMGLSWTSREKIGQVWARKAYNNNNLQRAYTSRVHTYKQDRTVRVPRLPEQPEAIYSSRGKRFSFSLGSSIPLEWPNRAVAAAVTWSPQTKDSWLNCWNRNNIQLSTTTALF